jgi:hypothetical protein
MRRSTFFLFCLLFICGCEIDKKTLIKDDRYDCISHSVLLVFDTNESLINDISKEVSISSGDTLSLLKSYMELVTDIHSLSGNFIRETGGVNPKTGRLIEPCGKGRIANEIFGRSHIIDSVFQKIEIMKKNRLYTDSKNIEYLVNFLEKFLGLYFKYPDPYSTKSYFNEYSLGYMTYTQISLDLSVMNQIVLYKLLNSGLIRT